MPEKEANNNNPSSQETTSGVKIFEELFTLAPTPHAVFDNSGPCLLANRAFRTQMAIENEDFLETSLLFKDLVEKPDRADQFLAQLFERQVIRRREIRLKDLDGRVFTALISGRIIEYAGQDAFEISFTDISRQKKLQAAVRREHARLYSLVENLTAGLFLVNNEGNVTDVNMWLVDLLGLDQERLLGQPFQEIFAQLISLAAEPEFVKQALDKAMTAFNEKPSVEFTIRKEKPLHLEITFFPVWDEDGLPLGWGGLVQDFTILRDQISWKLELLSILAHDIRTPLATLKGHATALLSNYPRWGNEMVTEFLEAINRGVDELVHQVDQSLALTRVETGRLGLHPEAMNPEKVIHQSLERAAGVLADLQVELDLPETLPEVRVDPARIEEVFTNLLENAARYNPVEKPIIIRAEPITHMLKISVIDYGPGIPEEKKSQIFEKFVRADAEGGGTGLGLFISRKIVEAHGGRIWVESPPPTTNQGSAFIFTLPLMPSIAPDKQPMIRESQPTLAGTEKGIRVLVVEDEPEMQALLRAILIEDGYQVEIAPDGPTALDMIQTLPPDVVLLDWVMAGMSGLIVCRNIRRWSDVPIMMVTSMTSQEELVAALDAGADDYVIKPFVSSEILARIRALLRRGEAWSLEDAPDRFSADGLVIDFETRQVWLQGELIELTPTEYNLLAYLARHPRMVLTYRQLITNVWEGRGEVTRHGLFVHVSRLRNKIETNPDEPRFIVTRWGMGYIFMPAQE
jgi:PAS domain S-box-containing protein